MQMLWKPIYSKIIANWSRPDNLKPNLEVVILVTITPHNGVVKRVEVFDSSGDGLFDKSVVNAVKKLSRFPKVWVDSGERKFDKWLFVISSNDQDFHIPLSVPAQWSTKQTSMKEETTEQQKFWDLVTQDIESGIEAGYRIDERWTTVISESNGDKEKAKDRYLEVRSKMHAEDYLIERVLRVAFLLFGIIFLLHFFKVPFLSPQVLSEAK